MVVKSAPTHHYRTLAAIAAAVLIASLITPTLAQDDPNHIVCELGSDRDPLFHFLLRKWVQRGDCIRSSYRLRCDHIPDRLHKCVRSNIHLRCDEVLDRLLTNLVSIRAAEYAGAASVLSLLPTIGALLGPPTSEIWRLISIVPFGGILAMTLSFGGALMPVRVEDYETTLSRRDTATGSIISLRSPIPGNRLGEPEIEQKLRALSDKVRERLDLPESVRLPKRHLLLGLFIMLLLMALAQGAMGVVEQGGIINWWCSCNLWMHLWYFGGMFSTTESDLQRETDM